MTADPMLALALLVLGHLVADFVIQTDRIATDKFATGRRAWRGLGMHIVGVAVCLIPVVAAFGGPGLGLLIVVTFAHAIVDRSKIIWTRRVEARALAEAHRAHAGGEPSEGFGLAWTAKPAALFVLDQAVHLVVLGWAWALFVADAPLTQVWVDVATRAAGGPGGWDPATVHRVALVSVIVLDLLIVNVRAGSLFVSTLVRPRAMISHDTASEAPPRTAPPARIGEAIGVLERLLIVTFVLVGAEAAVGFVVAAKTLARFKQLDDRAFAEYYLLGTLASVGVALVSSLIARAAIG